MKCSLDWLMQHLYTRKGSELATYYDKGSLG